MARQPEDYDERAEKTGDALRAMLTTLASAGIAGAFAVRESEFAWGWRTAFVCFALSLGSVLTSCL